MKRHTFIIVAASLLLLVAGCNRGKGSGGAKISEETQPVMVEELSFSDLDEYITVSGKLEGITDITMVAEATGRVMQLYKRLGDSVSQGERIGRLDNEISQIRLEQAEAAFASAQASMENAQRNYDAVSSLKARNLASEAEYSNALSALRGARAGLDGARAAMEQARSGINASFLSAPEAGIISNLNVSVGQFLAAGQPVASITDARTLILKTGVGESYISKLRVGQAATVTHTGSDKVLTGRLRGFGIRPAPGVSSYPIEIEITSPQGLLPGMVASARIMTNRYQSLLYTSITNVVKEFDRSYLFVVGEDLKAQKREVKLGRSVGEFVEILSGVEAGERIVTSGSENLEEGSLVEIRS